MSLGKSDTNIGTMGKFDTNIGTTGSMFSITVIIVGSVWFGLVLMAYQCSWGI